MRMITILLDSSALRCATHLQTRDWPSNSASKLDVSLSTWRQLEWGHHLSIYHRRKQNERVLEQKKRDEIRRREFLKRKEAAHRPSVPQTEPDIFSSLAHLGTGDPSHVDQPSAEAAQNDTVDNNPKNLNLRIEKSASGTWSVSPSLSRRNSPCQEVPECRNCHEPFLLNHQCDESYDEDDEDEFGDDSDDSDWYAKYLRHNEALECECSVHSTFRSPQPKKPRNSWRKYSNLAFDAL